MNFRGLFAQLGFDFEQDLKSVPLVIETDEQLSLKLKNALFFYRSPAQTNTSFYLVANKLEDAELDILRKYIWNEDKAYLIFYYSTDKLHLFYAKASPIVKKKKYELDVFKVTEIDSERIDKIARWQFDSGAFWYNYSEFVAKAKYKSVDQDLISTLASLKDQLLHLLSSSIINNNPEEIVQALIDRTLYIKFLEDKHIINSAFYHHYFQDPTLNYKQLLERGDKNAINGLFKIIHKIFNNKLFDQPIIDDRYLTDDVCQIIAQSFHSDLNTGQLRLFDFRFDVLPVEFISYIYEIFLSKKQKTGGIYYTPKKLAQLIVDDVIIDGVGRVLDPSCGSGMFLIVAFQRLLEIVQSEGSEPTDSIAKIRFRINLLSENIFGIEKELIAQRFALFSLSLQIFNGIDPNEIKRYIADQLAQHKEIDLFNQSSFFNNIKCANTLIINEYPLKKEIFDYIVGNPPFFEIKNMETEIAFLNQYKQTLADKEVYAKDIVENNQISQCFFLRIKDFSKPSTRFGFVSNSSNFYSSPKFQDYFYTYYGIERIYELSRVKSILFENAKESVLTLIFTNVISETAIKYYPVDLGLFTEKPFELLIIQEDKVIAIDQNKLQKKEIRLRDFLLGNEYDRQLVHLITDNNKMSDYVVKRKNGALFIHAGLQIAGVDKALTHFNITREEYNKDKKQYLSQLEKEFIRNSPDELFQTPLLADSNIQAFVVNGISKYVKNTDNFRRKGIEGSYDGERIIWGRMGHKLSAVYTKDKLYFDFDIYVVKLKDTELYYLITAILNSELVNYFVNNMLRKRVFDFHPKIDKVGFANIPIPKDLDEYLVTKITQLSKDLTEQKYTYAEKSVELNDLIYDLYDLGYLEKQRIKDYFLPKTAIADKAVLEIYKSTFADVVNRFLKHPINIEFAPNSFGLIVAKIVLNKQSSTPSADKTKKYILNEIFKQTPKQSFLAIPEMIVGKDCIYVIRKNKHVNWTETKAFEDGQKLLQHLMR